MGITKRTFTEHQISTGFKRGSLNDLEQRILGLIQKQAYVTLRAILEYVPIDLKEFEKALEVGESYE